MAANTSEQKLQNELDFTSLTFNALKALYSKHLQPPVPNARIFNNINEYAKSLAGKNEPKQTAEGDLASRLKNIAENRLNKLRNRKRDASKLEHLMKVKSQTDDIVEKVAMLEKTKKKGQRQQMNVLERMEEKYKEGPLSILYNCIEKKTKLKVWTRKLKGLRGVFVGYLIAFDKHMNLAMMDVDEMFAIEEEVVVDPAASLAESLKKIEKKKEKKRKWRRKKRERLRNNERMVEDNGNESLKIDFKARECSGIGLLESSTSAEIENSRTNISGDKDGNLDRQSEENTVQCYLGNDLDNENQEDNPSDRLTMSLTTMECFTTNIGLFESNASEDTENNERKEDSSQNCDSEGFTMEMGASECCTTSMGLFASSMNINPEDSEPQLKKRERSRESGERTMNEEGDGRNEGFRRNIKVNEYSTNTDTMIGLIESNIIIVDENSEINSLKNNDGVPDSSDCQANYVESDFTNNFYNESLRGVNLENQSLVVDVKGSDISIQTDSSQISNMNISRRHESDEENLDQQQVDARHDLKNDLDNAKDDDLENVSPKTDTQAKPLDFVNESISVDKQDSQKPLRHFETKVDVVVGDKEETSVQISIGGEQTQDPCSDGEDMSAKMSESFRSGEEEGVVELVQEKSDGNDLSTNDEGNKDDSFGEEKSNNELTIYGIMKEVKRTESELKEAGTLLSNDKNTNTYPYKPYSILQGNVLAMEFDEGSQDSVMFDWTVDREWMGVQAVTLHHKITYGMEETRSGMKRNKGDGSLVEAVRDGNDDRGGGVDEGGGEDLGYDNAGNNSDSIEVGSSMNKADERSDGCYKYNDGISNDGGEDVSNDSESMEESGSSKGGKNVDGNDGSQGGFNENDDGNDSDGENLGYDNDSDYFDDIDCVMNKASEKDDASSDVDGSDGDSIPVDDGGGNNGSEYVGNTNESDGGNDEDVGYDGDDDGTITHGGEMVDSATNKVDEKADGGDGISDDGIIGLGKGTDDHSNSHDGNYGGRTDDGTSHDHDNSTGNESDDGTSIVTHVEGTDNDAGSHGGNNIGNSSNDGGDSIEGNGTDENRKQINIDEQEEVELCSAIKDKGSNSRDEEHSVAEQKLMVRATDVSQSGNIETTKQEHVEEKEEGELTSSSDGENLEECGNSRQDKKQHKADLEKVLAPKSHEKKSNIRLKSTGTTSKRTQGDKEKVKRRNSISCTRERSSEMKDKQSDEKREQRSEKERRRSLVEKRVDHDDRPSRRTGSKDKTEGRKISLSKERKTEKDNIKTTKERRSSSTNQKRSVTDIENNTDDSSLRTVEIKNIAKSRYVSTSKGRKCEKDNIKTINKRQSSCPSQNRNVTDIGENTDDSSSRTIDGKDTAETRKTSTSKGRECEKDNVKTTKERRTSSTSQKRYPTEKEVDKNSSSRKTGTKENAENRKSLRKQSKSKEDNNKTMQKKRNSTTIIKLDTSSSSRDAKSKDSVRKSKSITSSRDKLSDQDNHEKRANDNSLAKSESCGKQQKQTEKAKVSGDKTSREDQIHHKESGKRESRSSSASSIKNLSRNKGKESDDKHKTQVKKSRNETSPVESACKRTTRKSSSKEVMNKSSEMRSKGKDVEPVRNVSKDSSKRNDRKSVGEKSSASEKVRRSSRLSVEKKGGEVLDKKQNNQEIGKKDSKRAMSKTKDKTDAKHTRSGKKPELVKPEDCSLKSRDNLSLKREKSSLEKDDGCKTGKTEELLVTCGNNDNKSEQSVSKKLDNERRKERKPTRNAAQEKSFSRDEKPPEENKMKLENDETRARTTQMSIKITSNVSEECGNKKINTTKSLESGKEKLYDPDERTQKKNNGSIKKKDGSWKTSESSKSNIAQKVKTETLTGKESAAKRKRTVEEYKSKKRSDSEDRLKNEANKTSKTVDDKTEKSSQSKTLKQPEKLQQPTRSRSQKQINKGDEEKLSGKRKRDDTPVRSQKVRKTTEMDANKKSVKFVKTKEAKLPGNVVTVRILKVERGKALVLKRRHVNQLFIRGDNIIMVAYENVGASEIKL